MSSVYRIREVDGFDDEIAEQIHELHRLTSDFPALDATDLEAGHWWLAWPWGSWSDPREPVAFAGMIPSDYPNAGYFKRVGVMHAHRGRGLQFRFMKAMERRARRNGWDRIVSDTTNAPHSANNFIRAGYRIFEPGGGWAFPETIYWEKRL
jgi:GNAT superfamily N-acetyltransferase